MESPPPSSDVGDVLTDPSKPFQGVVVCCTSIPPERRTDLSKKTKELGGVHKYDLTPDVTHLVVGEYDTPKYRHVAKERPDIRPMAVGWIDAVLELWIKDSDIDFGALEKEWSLRTFETGGISCETSNGGSGNADRAKLLCCLTGFDDPDLRHSIIEKIVANGGDYTGDLTRKVTHLIVFRPEGRKYTAAKSWGVHTVAIEWLHDSIERGMILDESCYDPLLPKEERGKDAWTKREVRRVSLGKRLREIAAPPGSEQGRRKIKKTASLKLSSQRENLWGDILGNQRASTELFGEDPVRTASSRSPSRQRDGNEAIPHPTEAEQPGNPTHVRGAAISSEQLAFSSCYFYVHGFSGPQTQILTNTIMFMAGRVASSLDELATHPGISRPFLHRFLIVPQNSKADTYPPLPASDVEVVTEFYIERCLHKKQFFAPEDHVIGRPFARFPIRYFEKLAICTAGFTGVDLNQVDKTIRQLGANYEERFTPQSSVLLVCGSLSSVRKQKLDLALAWRVPVVRADWLWECVSTGRRAALHKYLFPELKQRLTLEKSHSYPPEDALESEHKPQIDTLPRPAGKTPDYHAVDISAFESNLVFQELGGHPVSQEESGPAHFETAPTRPVPARESTDNHSGPLSEASAQSLNKSPSPHKIPRTFMNKHQPLENAHGEDWDIEPDQDKQGKRNGDENIVAAVGSDTTVPNGAKSNPAREEVAFAADEREALSTRLTTLLEAAPPNRPLAGGSPENRSVRDDTSAARPTRRRRGIMGRAVSNVSAASSASLDSTAGAPQTGGPKATSAAASFAMGSECFGEEHSVDSGSKIPAATQIEYDDPEAKKYKAQLLSKMMGAPPSDVDFGKSQGEKRTMREVRGLRADASSSILKPGRNMRRR